MVSFGVGTWRRGEGSVLKHCWDAALPELLGLNSRLMGAAVTVEREMNPMSSGSVAACRCEIRC